MNRIPRLGLWLSIAACLSTFHLSSAALLGPSSYASFSDSPFDGGSYDYFYLDDFEDSALNTPGVSASTGSVLNFGSLRDSVDSDDGSIDGSGSAGFSYYVTQSTVTFTFDAGALGALPTHAGLVLTDVGFVHAGSIGVGVASFEAFDEVGASLGVLGPGGFGDGLADGRTDEDRFYGATHASGISKISLTLDSDDWEMDHLQYGHASVPEPSSMALLLVAMLGILAGRRWR